MPSPGYGFAYSPPRQDQSLVGGLVHMTGRNGSKTMCLPAVIIAQYGTNHVYGVAVLLGIIGTGQTIYQTEWHSAYDCRHSRGTPEMQKTTIVAPADAILWIPRPDTRRTRGAAKAGPAVLRPVPPEGSA